MTKSSREETGSDTARNLRRWHFFCCYLPMGTHLHTFHSPGLVSTHGPESGGWFDVRPRVDWELSPWEIWAGC